MFFMNVGATFTPIGFIKVAGPVTKVQWSPPRFVSLSRSSKLKSIFQLQKKCMNTVVSNRTAFCNKVLICEKKCSVNKIIVF